VEKNQIVRLAIDFENQATEWWESGGRELWEALVEDFDAGSVIVDSALAESWLGQAASLPGWDAGTEFSRHPVFIRPIDEDEEV
jgi:hypothetical protein